MTGNRSSEELEMRTALEAWGRARLPGCRVMHELATGGCRIDLAFVGTDDIVCVEIKSSRDTLDRLDRQWDEFTSILPEVWLAVAPKYSWRNRPSTSPFIANEIVIEDGKIVSESRQWKQSSGHRNWRALSHMPGLLHVAENRRILQRFGIKCPARAPQHVMRPLIIRNLTGDQIVREVCRELRCRPTGWVADQPDDRDAA